MQSTTTYSRGEVVFVPFRFTEHDTKSKNRPAVIVSSGAYHRTRQDVVIAGITSNVSREGFVGNVYLSDWRACGLAKPSAVSGILMTIRDTRIGRRLGVLSEHDRGQLDAALREIFDL